ncbi:MAG: hypothetical protein J0H07_13460 [Sphingobacteriales bacterium]|nr:hypothetical protein [Sphingobacteriales bacterium]
MSHLFPAEPAFSPSGRAGSGSQKFDERFYEAYRYGRLYERRILRSQRHMAVARNV